MKTTVMNVATPGITILVLLFAPTRAPANPDLLVALYSSTEIVKYDGETGLPICQPWVSDSELPGGPTMIVGPDCNLYVTNHTYDRVDRYGGLLACPGIFIGPFTSAPPDGPGGLAFGCDGNLYVVSVHQYYLHIYDGVSGAPLGPPIPCAHNPSYVGFSPDCDLLTNSNSTDAILKWNGSEWIYFVQPGAGGLDFPGKFAFGPDGHLYVCSRYTDEILRYNGETGAPYPGPGKPGAVFASGCGLDFPYDLAFGPSDGNLYVVGPYTDGVLEFDGATGDCIEPPPFADCGPAWTLAFVPDPDTDDDLIPDACDNCPNEYNPGQEDCNDDGEGDICDPDPGEGDGDADGVCDYADVCPCTPGFVEFVDDEGRPKGDLDDDCDVDLNDFATFAGSYGAVACQ